MTHKEQIKEIYSEKGAAYVLDMLTQVIWESSNNLFHFTEKEKQSLMRSYLRDLKTSLEIQFNVKVK